MARSFHLAVSFLIAGVVLAAPALPPGVTRGASVEGITEYDLPNGLRVLLFPDQTKTTTTVNITYLVGSRNESYGETGMAHLLEHLLFKPSPRHSNIPQELNAHGARFNGTTSWDRTNYFETFEGTDENLNWALDLESDRMVNAAVDRKDLDTEMTVVRNEFESGENNPSRVLFERVMSAAYLFHNYGKPVIGSRSDIEHVPIEHLQAFYHRYYAPDNAVLTIAGHVDEEKTLQLVAKYFSSVPKPNRELPPTYTEEPPQDGERTVMLRRTGDSKIMMLGVHTPPLSDPDGSTGGLLGDILANAPSGRLYKALVETKKAGSVSDYELDLREPSLLILVAQAPNSTDADDLRKSFEQVVDDVRDHPPTDEEVRRSQVKIGGEIELTLRNSEQVGRLLSEYIAAGDWRLAFITRDRIKNATTAEVDKFARTYLLSSNRTIGLFVPTDKPERAQVPPMGDIATLVKNYKGGEGVAQGEAFEASPANIDKRTVVAEAEPGIKMRLLSKKTRGEVVTASIRLHFGDENSLKGKDVAGSLTGAMLSRGTSAHTRQQITDEFNRLKAQVHISGDATGATAIIQTVKASLPEVITLIAECFRSPVFPQPEFDSLKQEWITGIESQKSEPQAIAMEKIERHLNPYPVGDVRYAMSMQEQLEALKTVTLDDVKQFHREFYGANSAEIAVVGDFTPDQLKSQVASAFKGWKSAQAYHRVISNFKDVPPINEGIDTPDKANSFFVAAQPFKLSDASADYPALVMANYILGGGALNSRLATRIRVKDGLSYGVGSRINVPIDEDESVFMANAISAPQNTSKVEADFKDELERALKSGFTQEELTQAKSGWLQGRQVSRAHDNELAAKLATYAQFGRSLDWDAQLESKIKDLNLDQVNAALRQYVDPSKISIIKAGDFSKAASPVGGGTK
jgi:zinc protease